MATKVLVTAAMPGSWLDPLRDAQLEVEEIEGLVGEKLAVAAAEVDAIVCLLTDRIDAAVLEAGAAGRLRVVANIAVGYDNIDVERAGELGIAVCNTPGVLSDATADVAMYLILAACRQAPQAERILREGGWHGWELTGFLGTEVSGATLGVVGYGRIGRALARRAEGFSMRVLHHDIVETGEPGYVADLAELLTRADVASIHVPLSSATRGLIGARELALLGPSGVLVNTARGGVVDEEALADALQSGQLGAAGLDVYVGEPRVDPRLLAAPRLVLLPHIGSATWETRGAMARLACQGVVDVLSGRRPPNLVAPHPGPCGPS